MNIVHLIDYFQPKIGYQETFLAREHRRLGHTVHVVTSDRYYPFEGFEKIFSGVLKNRIVGQGRFTEEGISVCRLKTWEIPGSPLPLLLGLKNLLEELTPDIVFCHGVYSLTSFAISRQKKNFALIYDTHAAAFNTDFSTSSVKRLYHEVWKRIFFPSIQKNADAIFSIGDEEREFLCRDTGMQHESIPIIRLGVDTARFCFNASARKKIRSTWGVMDSDTVFIFAGKMIPGKKTHILVDAFVNVRNPSSVLVLVGRGNEEYMKKLRTFAGNTRVIFLPFTDNRTLAGYFSAADVAVWPGDPAITMLEAMACRLPLVLPQRVGTMYLRESGGCVFLGDGSRESLSAVLDTGIKNPENMRNLGRKAERFIITRFTWKHIAEQTLALARSKL